MALMCKICMAVSEITGTGKGDPFETCAKREDFEVWQNFLQIFIRKEKVPIMFFHFSNLAWPGGRPSRGSSPRTQDPRGSEKFSLRGGGGGPNFGGRTGGARPKGKKALGGGPRKKIVLKLNRNHDLRANFAEKLTKTP